MKETGRDESQSVPSPQKLFKTRDLELPFFEGSLPSCSPHTVGYTRTSVHPYLPFAKFGFSITPGEEASDREHAAALKIQSVHRVSRSKHAAELAWWRLFPQPWPLSVTWAASVLAAWNRAFPNLCLDIPQSLSFCFITLYHIMPLDQFAAYFL